MGLAAAFFDVDRTLIMGGSLEACFLRYARHHGVIGPTALARNILAGLQALRLLPCWGGERIPIPAGLPIHTRLRYAFLSGNKAYLRGLRVEDCQALAAAVFREEILARLSSCGEQVIREHRSAGHLIILLTGSLDFLGKPLQAHLGADLLVAARPEVQGGVLSGRLAEPHPYGARKRELLLHLARERGWDLDASYAYADHHTDVPFLETVGHPVAVNPDRRLSKVAQERGWRVERW